MDAALAPAWLAAGAVLAPALGAWLSYPRRPWGALAALFAALASGGALAASAPAAARPAAALTAAWAVLGAAALWAVLRRGEAAVAAAQARLVLVRTRRAQVAKELAALKARGLDAERAHKETMALYGMVKGLSESLSWNDARPRVETAFEQCFGANAEFALYVAGMKGEGDLHPLTVRGLRLSPGAQWSTLARLLQERGTSPLQPAVFAQPERAVGLPVKDGAEPLAYLYSRVPEGVAPEAWLGKLAAFADELTVAFRRLKLFQEVERLSEIDGLTGVRRRGAFDKKLADEVVRARTFKTTFGLLLLDIDHFKSLNDRYGHPFGDQVLKRVGAVLNASVYETDYVARYGGEEFVVLLPRAEPEGVRRKAEAIRQALEAERFPLGFEAVQVTATIGLAHFPRDAATPEELVAAADAALYAGKQQGRNRVVDCEVLRRAR
ncbi:MAG: GGDEF domain-containing protein [Elusimicrobiota bacterium]|nr:GGDEF domain-containing protein [Elusimicrobiota bacterium]